MNSQSEQITAGFNIVIDDDQPLRGRQLTDVVVEALGNRCKQATVDGKRVLVYDGGGKKCVLLTKAVSYLGNPHPRFKKRIQIPRRWIDFARKAQDLGYDAHFLGVYHYDGFVVFADFLAANYLQKNCHNSSAHVYINDLYQGAVNGVFEKTDQSGNHIATIARQQLGAYLQGNGKSSRLLGLFTQFNNAFPFGQWIKASECIEGMHKDGWSQWRQTEWQGQFVEYQFSRFVEQESTQTQMQYTALLNKGRRKNRYDFDVYFPKEKFMGDLKASDANQKASIGNAQDAFIECINQYGKFWYIVYEHDTVHDKDCDYEATKWRSHYVKDVDGIHDSKFKELSYKTRMKNSVRFRKMFIIELNRVNYRDVLMDFKQGHQPDGSKRKVKFSIPKKAIDNFVIYRYDYASSKRKFRFVDLFCGIGGFHQALSSLGGECVFASDIDPDCIAVYKDNYGLDSSHDMTRLDAAQVPPHDVLCAGFPCQAFSKAGKQAGVNDTRGTLFFEIERVLRYHHPPYIILENVRNLVAHDNGRTWEVITGVLRAIGYRLNAVPLILSPHQFGVPQLRERVYIVGKYDPEHVDEPLRIEFDNLMQKTDHSIYSVLEQGEVGAEYNITDEEQRALTAWDEFYQGINLKVIGFPVNTTYFHYDGDLSVLPEWKQSHIRRNKALYASNKEFIDKWLEKWNNLDDFTPTHHKFEWQCGTGISSVFEGLIQMRPSGIRVKMPNVFPALVAMVQIPIIGRYRRRLTERECARLQSFPDSFKMCKNKHQALKQFGNSVNINVLRAVFERLIEQYGAVGEISNI